MGSGVISFGFVDGEWSSETLLLCFFSVIMFLPFLLVVVYMFLLMAAHDRHSVGLHGGLQGLLSFYTLKVKGECNHCNLRKCD